jgi:hypothetical protein
MFQFLSQYTSVRAVNRIWIVLEGLRDPNQTSDLAVVPPDDCISMGRMR